jgi:hypothetical protein
VTVGELCGIDVAAGVITLEPGPQLAEPKSENAATSVAIARRVRPVPTPISPR